MVSRPISMYWDDRLTPRPRSSRRWRAIGGSWRRRAQHFSRTVPGGPSRFAAANGRSSSWTAMGQ
eukprot:2010856-Pyramimonas_sp.AAC.1